MALGLLLASGQLRPPAGGGGGPLGLGGGVALREGGGPLGGYSDGRLKIFSGSANPGLAQEIAQYLDIPLGDVVLGRFSNGEIKVIINESVRGCDAFIIQPTCGPANDTLMELLIMTDALRRASTQRVTAVLPFYGYARQDRKTRGREPITAKLVANLITVAGAQRVLAVDLHAGQIQGFFDIPVDHLSGVPILADYFIKKGLRDPVVVSPDTGGVARARDLAERLGAPMAIIDKRRPEPGVAEVHNVVGRVEGKAALIVDDMIDTAGSIKEAALALIGRGAREVYAACTHPVLSGQAHRTLDESPILEAVVTNTIPVDPARASPKVKVLSIASLLGEAIIRIHEDLSVSKLFD
ncbi:MAG: ribose-phosphate pyrophosphokinase [Firmicutes bacterium]|nr:ribose-phosphate pyrophosphokinase [Bacillota bacterium]